MSFVSWRDKTAPLAQDEHVFGYVINAQLVHPVRREPLFWGKKSGANAPKGLREKGQANFIFEIASSYSFLGGRKKLYEVPLELYLL